MRFNKIFMPVSMCVFLVTSNVFAHDISKLVSREGSAKQEKVLQEKTSWQINEESESSIQNDTQIVIGFSPEGSALAAIIDVINSAKTEVRLAAYSFTSPEVIKALTAAKKRGVNVKIVIDEKGNTSKSSKAAIKIVTYAKIPIKSVSKYDILHDKFIVVDRKSVQTGSYNYSRAANKFNSENVIVLYNQPQVATVYLAHWDSRWQQGKPIQLSE